MGDRRPLVVIESKFPINYVVGFFLVRGTEPRVSCILYHKDTYSLSVSILNLPGPLMESIFMASAIHSSGLLLAWRPHPVPLESWF